MSQRHLLSLLTRQGKHCIRSNAVEIDNALERTLEFTNEAIRPFHEAVRPYQVQKENQLRVFPVKEKKGGQSYT